MDNTYESTTVEMDHSGFEDLKDQILSSENNKESNVVEKVGEREPPKEKPQKRPSNKVSTWVRGDDKIELEDDYELELMADKRPVKMTLKELKERAAGDIAVKNRMHSLAEEKKRVQATFKEFARLSKDDPLGALEYISERAKEADGEFEYQKYINKLAEQAEKIGQMDDKERESWEKEKKLTKAEQDLSRKERELIVLERKQEMLQSYPEIGDSEFGQMVDAVLTNEELMEGLEDESDVLDRVEDLIEETLTQRDIMSVISEINPEFVGDNHLIFSLSDQIKQNPDFDEEDVREIISALIPPRERRRSPERETERERAQRTLSRKQRMASSDFERSNPDAGDFDLLKEQLLERKDELRKTPLYMR